MDKSLLCADKYILTIKMIDVFKTSYDLSIQFRKVYNIVIFVRCFGMEIDYPNIFIADKPYIPLPIFIKIMIRMIAENGIKLSGGFELIRNRVKFVDSFLCSDDNL